jgi:pyridinium-3,5-biscarboxylic acid mononucleotide sulfurtransferase
MYEFAKLGSGGTLKILTVPDQDLEKLVNWFTSFRSCMVAFSGGVDSSLLAFAARSALGDRAYAAISKSPAMAESEIDWAKKVAEEIGIELHEVIQNDLEDKEYVKNSVTRCYFCRSNLVYAMRPLVGRLAIEVCVDGTHADDMSSPRPGIKALREAGFRAPILELGFGKETIRNMARAAGLSTWQRPSEACLSSRIAFGSEIDLPKLRRVEAAENFVKAITQAKIVRVRTMEKHAIVEVEKEAVQRASENLGLINKKLRQLGYETIEIDKEGYRSGKMLELFVSREK